jgi:hypothetical protein
MAWMIRFGGVELDSDDMTIEELGEVEKVSGVPWSIANPMREIAVAKGFIAVMLLRSGKSEAEVVEALKALTLRDLKAAFEYRSDEGGETPGEGEEPDPSRPSGSTSRASSRGGRGGGGSPAT